MVRNVIVGRVSKLWRYPVKSMGGEECQVIDLENRGFRGDRLFAVRNSEGKLGSGKNTRRFRQIDGLLGFRAGYVEDWPSITFPDGRTMRDDDPQVHAALSDVLGVSVTLAREGGISHLDQNPVHLISAEALAWLESRLPGSRIDERRFRPNIVVTIADAEQPERSWVGKTLHIGEVTLRVTEQTERCRMITLGQGDLPDDPRVLKCVAQEADLHFGVYADVLAPGRITAVDIVSLST